MSCKSHGFHFKILIPQSAHSNDVVKVKVIIKQRLINIRMVKTQQTEAKADFLNTSLPIWIQN